MSLSNTRRASLDVLRTFALTRVFLWHATGYAFLTWIAVLPALMYITGIFLAVSYAKSPIFETLKKRFARAIVPFWFYGLTAILVMRLFGAKQTLSLAQTLRWVLPYAPVQGVEWTQGWLSSPLWYVSAYLWLLLASPLLYMFLVRARLRACVGLGILLGAIVLYLEYRYINDLWFMQDIAMYGFFLYAGMLVTVKKVSLTQKILSFCATMSASGVTLLLVVSEHTSATVNDSHTMHALVGIVCISLFFTLERGITRVTKHIQPLCTYVSGRSMTIYLWHSGVTALTILVLNAITDWPGAVNVLAYCVAALGATMAVVYFTGFVETLASNKKIRVKAASSTVCGFVVCALALATVSVPLSASESLNTDILPPTPSQGPSSAYTHDAAYDEQFFNGDAVTNESAPTTSPAPSGEVRKKYPTTTTTTTTTTTPAVVADNSRKYPVYNSVTVLPTETWENLAPDADYSVVAEIEKVLSDSLQGTDYSGVEVLIVRPGVTKLSIKSDGSSSSKASLVNISSVTKSFTGSLVLRAVAEGRVNLDDRFGVLRVAPWFTMAQDVTIGDMLLHRSGIVSYTETATYKENSTNITDWSSALKSTSGYPLLFTPGSTSSYSSTNYILLGLLLEQIYGDSIERLIEVKLLKPLGLEDSAVIPSYPGNPGTGTGNMTSSMRDLVRWTNARWRASEVLTESATSPKDIFPYDALGYGQWGFCPCSLSKNKISAYSGVGISGGDITLRYYRDMDAIVVLRMDGGIWNGGRESFVNKLIANMLVRL